MKGASVSYWPIHPVIWGEIKPRGLLRVALLETMTNDSINPKQTPSNSEQPPSKTQAITATSGFNLTVLRYRLPGAIPFFTLRISSSFILCQLALAAYSEFVASAFVASARIDWTTGRLDDWTRLDHRVEDRVNDSKHPRICSICAEFAACKASSRRREAKRQAAEFRLWISSIFGASGECSRMSVTILETIPVSWLTSFPFLLRV